MLLRPNSPTLPAFATRCRWLFTGFLQAVEAKEGLPIQNESVTLASVSYQAFFRNFPKLAGRWLYGGLVLGWWMGESDQAWAYGSSMRMVGVTLHEHKSHPCAPVTHAQV